LTPTVTIWVQLGTAGGINIVRVCARPG